MDALNAIERACSGEDELDVEVLHRLAYRPVEAHEHAPALMQALLRLAAARPGLAELVPNTLVTTLLGPYTLAQVLDVIEFEPPMLQSSLLLHPLLTCAAKHARRTAELTTRERNFFGHVLPLLADPGLETETVALIEAAARATPAAALQYTAFKQMYAGSAEVKARLMAINTILVESKLLPPLDYLLWSPLEDPVTGDIILAALEIDYVGDLAAHMLAVSNAEFSFTVREALEELCLRYLEDTSTAAIERVFGRLASSFLDAFAQLDSKYSLVALERPRLLALLPPSYLLAAHADKVAALNLNSRNFPAIVNVIQDPAAFDRLAFTEAQALQLPKPMQLELAAAATHTDVGAKTFASKFPQVLQNAYSMPVTEEAAGYIAKLKENLRRSGVRVARETSVAIAA